MSKNQLRVYSRAAIRLRESLPLFGFKTVVAASWFPMVGVTGFEPVTLRLSSACSNQLSYTPAGI